MQLDYIELQRSPNSPINTAIMEWEITWTKYLLDDNGFEVGLKWIEDGHQYVPDEIFVPGVDIQSALFWIALQREIDRYIERNN